MATRIKRVILITIGLMGLLTTNLYAEDISGWVNVLNVGCHPGICWVSIDQQIGGVTIPCYGSNVRFNINDPNSPNLKAMYASLLTAVNSGKQVRIAVNGCYDEGPTSYPTLSWVTVGQSGGGL